MTQTDADGIERELALAFWNGRLVLIDDGMPTEEVTDGEDTYTAYTTYVLGENSVILDDIGDSVPYEMSRDAKTNGGQDTLYVRDRFVCGVDGISFEKPASITALLQMTILRLELTGTSSTMVRKAIPPRLLLFAK